MAGTRYTRKPPRGARLDPGHVFGRPSIFVPCWDGGPFAADIVTGTRLGITSATWATATGGYGLQSMSSASFAQGVLPATLKLPWPMTIAVGLQVIGTIASGKQVVTYQIDVSANPALEIYTSGTSGGLVLYWRSSNTLEGPTTICSSLTSGPHVVSATVTPTRQATYVDGAMGGSSSVATSNVTFTVPRLSLLGSSNFTGATGWLVYWVGLWPIAAPADWHARIGQSVDAVWGAFRPAIDWAAIAPRKKRRLKWWPGLDQDRRRSGGRI